MDHKLIPLVLIMIGTLVSVVFATSAVQPNPVAAEYPLPPRPPVVPPDPRRARAVVVHRAVRRPISSWCSSSVQQRSSRAIWSRLR